IVKREWIITFCRKMLERGIRCTWQLPSGTRSEAIDDEVVDLLYQSGCRNISYAPESGSPRMLRRIRKQVKLPRMLVSMRGAVGRGLNVKANILVGFPGERHSDVWRSLAFIFRMARVGVHDIHMQGYTPYPGAALYDELRASGRLPAFGDAYCTSLVKANAGVTDGISYSEHIGNRSLGLYRFAGFSLFYFVRYVLRPTALWRMIGNIRRGVSESRGEQALISFLERRAADRMARAVVD
ncbi:MAG: B12-binding domain-containing radical SAM protein, partial [Phycisphaerae bacterium]